MKHVDVCAVEDVPPGKSRPVRADGRDIALLNVDGTVYAINDACLHHGSSLGSGQLQGKVVTCPAHGWRYDVTTGFVSHVPDYGVACYAVKVTDGKIFVSV